MRNSVFDGQGLKDYLRFTADSRRLLGQFRQCDDPSDNKWEYSCIEEFVLRNGRSLGGMSTKPRWIPQGTIKECFSNCFNILVRYPETVTYCEGYATGIIPVHHAWLLYKNKVIDPTWHGRHKMSSVEYYGIPFRYDYVVKTAIDSGYYSVLDNFAMRYPLLSGKHQSCDYLAHIDDPAPTTP